MTLSLIVVALLVVGVTLLFLFGAPKKPVCIPDGFSFIYRTISMYKAVAHQKITSIQRKDNGKLPPYLSGIPVLGTMLQYNKDPKKFVTENGKKVWKLFLCERSQRFLTRIAPQFGVFMIDLAGRDAVVLSDRMALQQFYNAPEYEPPRTPKTSYRR